jgi:hypothetical protein
MPRINRAQGVSLGLTDYGKEQLALQMCDKGKNFIGTSILLRKSEGNEYVVLYLLCQGIEVFLKGVLLLEDYDKYKPLLEKYGHNLVKISKVVTEEFSLKEMRPDTKNELKILNKYYSKHLLRYGSIIDIIVDPKTIQSERVLRKILEGVRLAKRKLRPNNSDER